MRNSPKKCNCEIPVSLLGISNVRSHLQGA
jgi:hypothetical protein